MTDREILELLLKKFDDVDKRFEGIDKRFDSTEKRLKKIDSIDDRVNCIEKRLEKVDSIDKKVSNIGGKLDSLENRFDEHEAKNAERHLEMINQIKELRNDLAAVETITAKNWRDLVHLKAAK